MHEEGQRRQANDNGKMFELQILQMKELMSAETNEDNNLVDLTTKLAERTAVEILRAELNELKPYSTVHAKGSSSKVKAAGRFSNHKKVMDMTDLSVLELRCPRIS